MLGQVYFGSEMADEDSSDFTFCKVRMLLLVSLTAWCSLRHAALLVVLVLRVVPYRFFSDHRIIMLD